MDVSDARKLKGLEEKNAKLKKLLAVPDAGRGDARGDAGKELLTPGSRRAAVNWAMARFVPGCACWPVSDDGLATGDCTSCSRA